MPSGTEQTHRVGVKQRDGCRHSACHRFHASGRRHGAATFGLPKLHVLHTAATHWHTPPSHTTAPTQPQMGRMDAPGGDHAKVVVLGKLLGAGDGAGVGHRGLCGVLHQLSALGGGCGAVEAAGKGARVSVGGQMGRQAGKVQQRGIGRQGGQERRSTQASWRLRECGRLRSSFVTWCPSATQPQSSLLHSHNPAPSSWRLGSWAPSCLTL